MLEFLVCLLAGFGAGIGTGFAGISAAAVISPMLIAFLDMPAYQAVGISLASDVLASAASAYTYKKNKNFDVKNGLIMMASVLVFTVLGSILSKFVPNTTLGFFTVFATFIMGLKFLIWPVMTSKEKMLASSHSKRIVRSVIFGAAIGFICGFTGAGGGLMMLFILTTVLGYELKTAVGTSVFIMTFTALTGAVGHFAMSGTPDLFCAAVCIFSTLIWAIVGARIANHLQPRALNRITGILLTVLGAIIIAVKFFVK